jgi:hypothetical protein
VAATWKICQKYGLFGPQYDKKLGKYTQNIEKSLILNLSLSCGFAGKIRQFFNRFKVHCPE